ncbi:MAG: hypothetical protein JOZ39_09685, partial [Chloroflexi bacterium]|nr:hypothetical protein [Chloroflexota bacterium]
AIAEQMSASSSDVVAAINRISHVVVQNSEQTELMSQRSRENMAASEEVQAATRRMSEQVAAMHLAAQQLKGLSTSLQTASTSFRV